MSKTKQRELSAYQLGAETAYFHFKIIGYKNLSKKKCSKYFRRGFNSTMRKQKNEFTGGG